MTVVEDDLERVFVENISPAGSLEERRIEGLKPVADVLELDAHAVGDGRGEHGVLDVVHRPAFDGGGDEMGPQERDVVAFVVDGDHVSVHTDFEHNTSAAGTNVLAHQRMLGAHGHVADVFGLRVVCHAQAQGIIRVEHRRIACHLDDDALDCR